MGRKIDSGRDRCGRRGDPSRRASRKLVLILGLFLFAASTATAFAAEAPPPLFTQIPEDGVPGVEAGRLAESGGVAIDPTTRHLFVIEQQAGTKANNNRISEFTAWGEFVKAFGYGVRNGADELQTCTKATGCLKGLEGIKPGEFERPNGLAFDAAGNLYVFERRNGRVQKFDPTAGLGGTEVAFVLSWGSKGTANGQFNIENQIGVDGNYIAIDPGSTIVAGGAVYVADKGRIQAFDTAGNFKFSFLLPQDLNPGALAFDSSKGYLYFAFNQPEISRPEIYRLEPPTGKTVGEPIVPDVGGPTIEDAPIALATDPSGNVYVVDDPLAGGPARAPRVLKFSPIGAPLTEFDLIPPAEAEPAIAEPGLAVGVVGETPTEIDVYVSHRRFSEVPGVAVSSVKVYGVIPDPDVVGPPPKVPPEIQQQYALSVGPTEATLRAAINPKFWPDTTYYVEYGVVDCEPGPCTSFPPPPGATLTKKITGTAVTTAGVFLTGLEPSKKYFYRFVSQSSGSDGQPVFGVGGKVGVDGTSGTFTTPRDPDGDVLDPCPENEAFRFEAGAKLPDCRAYEMVSPVDKNGADISVVFNVTGYPAGFNQGDPDGEEVSFAAYRSFGDAISAPYAVQYLVSRGGSGWSTHSLSPPRSSPSVLIGKYFDNAFRAFTPDLDSGWVFHDTTPLLDPAAPAGYANLYRRDNTTGGYEALVNTTAPNLAPTMTPGEFFPELQGYAGPCTIFRANDKLTSDALANGKPQIYSACKGQPLELVSLLPGAAGPAVEASVGTGGAGVSERISERLSRVDGAVSDDGKVVFWSDNQSDPGKLYARQLATDQTVALSSGPAVFWAGSADGTRAVFTQGTNLYAFTLGANTPESPTLIAEGVAGVMGASDDASRIYLVSSKGLAPGATEGKPNLYLYDSAGPSFTYVATLASADANASSTGLAGPIKIQPVRHTSQVTADGGAVAFTSVASLTGFDNADAETGKPDSEVFVYRAGPDSLVCASCNPSGARPSGREVIIKASGTSGTRQPTAGELPAAANQLVSPRVISANGNRVYFNSYVPLVHGDTNGKADVYQWEALGEGGCKEAVSGYDADFEGCVNLISTGESPQDSEFVDASEDGRDVFFQTNDRLLPQDPGLVDIYDARAGGGFPIQLPPSPECQGEACQNPAQPPTDTTPATQSGVGPGNPLYCPKGSHKVSKGAAKKCVKNKKKKKHHKGNRGKQSKKSGRAHR
jgi:hypothetical protein